MSIVEVFVCRRLHMNTSMISVCIRLICILCTAMHTKCCGAVPGLPLQCHHSQFYSGLCHLPEVLSGMIQAQHFYILLESSSPASRSCLLSVAAPHASSWLSVVPSPDLGLNLESNEYQLAIMVAGVGYLWSIHVPVLS